MNNWTRRPETEQLVSLLSEMKEGDLISYGELSEAIGENVQKKAAPYLRSAQRILENEKHFMFEIVRGTGLRRCDPQDKTRKVDRKVKGARRAAVRGLKTLQHVTPEDRSQLTAEQRLRLDASGIVLTMIAQNANVVTINKVSNGQEVLPKLKLPKVS